MANDAASTIERIANGVKRLGAIRGVKTSARLFGPLLLAYLLILSEPLLAALVRDRPGILPVAMVALVIGIVIARVRRWLIVTLCYGIGLLALGDLQHLVPLPPEMDYVLVEQVYPYGWALLAIIALVAGAAEALYPASIWARRAYFAAAAVYLGGHGLIGILTRANYNDVILFLTGIFAAAGVFYAPKIVAREEQDERDDEDLRALQERAVERKKSLSRLEWQERLDDAQRPAELATRESL